MGSVFVSASSEKDLKNEACSNPLPPGARTKHVPSLHHRGRGTAPAVEGVRLSLLTERKCCAFCEKHGRRNQESDCDHFGDFLRISSTPDAPILFAIRRMYQANSFRRPTAATSPEGGGLENEARRGCMVGASPKNISSTLRSSETMIAVPSRPSAGWNRWVKKDPFLTYAPLGDPSCANMKQKPCGFREAPALRARRENGKMKRAVGAW